MIRAISRFAVAGNVSFQTDQFGMSVAHAFQFGTIGLARVGLLGVTKWALSWTTCWAKIFASVAQRGKSRMIGLPGVIPV
jgi:hypothetical protein